MVFGLVLSVLICFSPRSSVSSDLFYLGNDGNEVILTRHTCCLSFSKVSGSMSVGGTLERTSGESPSLDISLSLMGSSSPPED